MTTASSRLLDAATIFAVQASEIEEQYVQRATEALKRVQDGLVTEVQQTFIPQGAILQVPVAVANSLAGRLRVVADEILVSYQPLVKEAAEAYPRFLNRALTRDESLALSEQFLAPATGFDPDEVETADEEFDLQEDLFEPLFDIFLAAFLLSLRWQLLLLQEQWEILIQRQAVALRLRLAGAIALELQDATDGIVPDTKLRSVMAREVVNSLMGARGRGTQNRAITSIEALVRTQFQAVLDAVVRETHKKNSRLLAGEIWSATLDQATCLRCFNLHGKYFPLKDGESTLPEQPLHIRCRCGSIPVLKKVRGVEQVRPAKPEMESFPEWFARQPERLQRAWLGPARYQLYSSGKLSIRDFVQFRRKVPVRVRDLKALGRVMV